MVTHDANVAAHCQREIYLHDGKIADPADMVEGAAAARGRAADAVGGEQVKGRSMLFWMIVKVAFKSLMANKLRSMLAMLGIIIGVAAVIAMLAIGTGAKQQVLDRISAMGTNLLIVRPAQRGTAGVMYGTQLNLTDRRCPGICRNSTACHAVAPVGQPELCRSNTCTRTPRRTCWARRRPYLPIRDFEIGHGKDVQRF